MATGRDKTARPSLSHCHCAASFSQGRALEGEDSSQQASWTWEWRKGGGGGGSVCRLWGPKRWLQEGPTDLSWREVLALRDCTAPCRTHMPPSGDSDWRVESK